MTIKLIARAFLCAFLGAGAAHADDYSQEFQVGLDARFFHYKEYDARGRILDREDGFLPGITAGFEAGSGPNRIAMRAEAWNGAVDYDGQTQGGTPLRTSTDTTITNFSLAFKRDIPAGSHSATVFAELGTRRWDRKIRGTARTNSLYEVYHWPYYQLGAVASLAEKGKLSLAAKAAVGRTFSSTLDVHLSGFDTTTLDLPPGNTYRLSAPISYRLNANRVLTIEPYFHYWHFEASSWQPVSRNSAVVGMAQEPENETADFGINLSVQL